MALARTLARAEKDTTYAMVLELNLTETAPKKLYHKQL